MPPHSPFTEDDQKLLALYLDPGVALFALCDELHITYSQLERRLNQPHIREAIARAERLHTNRAKTLARCQADDAVATLNHIASHPDHNPETRRKAATTLQRMASPNASEGITTPAKASTTTASGSERTVATAPVRKRDSPKTHAHPKAPSPPGRGRLTCASRQPGEGLPHVPDAKWLMPPQPPSHRFIVYPFIHPNGAHTTTPPPDDHDPP